MTDDYSTKKTQKEYFKDLKQEPKTYLSNELKAQNCQAWKELEEELNKTFKKIMNQINRK